MSKKILLGAICTVLVCGISANVFAQNEPHNGVAPSLLTGVNPRAAGMGMATTAVNDNPFGIFNNAAVNLSSEKQMGFGYSYNPFMPEFDSSKGAAIHAVGGYYNIDDNNGLSLGFRYFNGLKTTLTDGNNNLGETIRSNNDLAVSLAYSRRIVDNFSMSLTARYIRSDFSNSGAGFKAGNAFTFDLGFYYNNTIDSFFGSTWAVGLNVSNVGTKLDISDPSNPGTLPAYANLGGSIFMPFSENHTLLAALDLGYTFMPSADASFMAGIGLEYNLFKYGIIRAGYHYGDEKAVGGSYATVGLGVKAGPVRIDGSYWIAGEDSPVRNTWTVGLSLFF